jgi:hypothetical protein
LASANRIASGTFPPAVLQPFPQFQHRFVGEGAGVRLLIRPVIPASAPDLARSPGNRSNEVPPSMENERSQPPTLADATPKPFSTAVRPNPDGGWLAEVNLGDGATLSKWFPSRHEAELYPEELAAWLRSRRTS